MEKSEVVFSFLKQPPSFYKQVCTLTIPIVLQNIITSTLTMADTFMVGLLGESQMAALTLANIPTFVIMLFLFGVQSGASILMSQYWGKQDFDSVQKVLGLSMWISAVVTGIFAVVLFRFPLEFLSLFGNDPEVVALASGYGKLIGFAFFINGFTLMYVGMYRSIGQPKLGMYLLGMSSGLNLFLNWVFIYGNLGAPALGVQGAAIATLSARVLELIVMVAHIRLNKAFPLKIKLILLPDKEIMGKFLKYCTPVVVNETLWGLGTSVYPSVMGHMEGSTEILAAMAIATNTERIVMVAGFGIAASTAIIIGNTVGAGNSEEKVVEIGYALGAIGAFVGFVSSIILLVLTFTLLPWVIAPLFLLSETATEISQIMLVMLSIFMALRTFNNVVVVGIFRGAGATKKSMIVDLTSLWFVAIPLSILFGLVLKLHVFWVTVAMASETIVKSMVALYYLRKKDWVCNVTDSVPEV